MNETSTLRGLVLRTVDMGESDRLMTILTAEEGKITLSAKGVRSVKSHRMAACQPFCYSEFTVNSRGAKRILTETRLIENFYAIREDIERFALASYLCEVTETVTVEDGEQGDILSLLLNCLYLIGNRQKELWLIKGVFEWRLAALLGFMPDLSVCAECGAKSGSMALSLIDGCLYCTDCMMKEKKPLGIWLDDTLPLLRYLLTTPAKRLFAVEVDGALENTFSAVCEKYLLHQVGRSFATLAFYKTLL